MKAPLLSPSRRTLNNYAIFYAKPSRKTLNKFGKPSTTLIIQKGEDTKALTLYTVQLIFNFFWSIWFFNLGWYLFAFLWLVALWILILATTVAFYRISKPAAWLMLPYLVWVAFAGYLNLGVWWLNR